MCVCVCVCLCVCVVCDLELRGTQVCTKLPGLGTPPPPRILPCSQTSFRKTDAAAQIWRVNSHCFDGFPRKGRRAVDTRLLNCESDVTAGLESKSSCVAGLLSLPSDLPCEHRCWTDTLLEVTVGQEADLVHAGSVIRHTCRCERQWVKWMLRLVLDFGHSATGIASRLRQAFDGDTYTSCCAQSQPGLSLELPL